MGKPLRTDNRLALLQYAADGHGLAKSFIITSAQKACDLGLFNTPTELLRFETASILQARLAKLGTYNDYRRAFNFPAAEKFDQISQDPHICQALEKLYGEVGNVEGYIGLFTENSRPIAAVMALIGRFVAGDAFSQALTNPLHARHIYNETTFSPSGLRYLQDTQCLEQNVNRTAPPQFPLPASQCG